MANAPDVTVKCPWCGALICTNGVYYHYDPGRTYGDPYYCYPPDEDFEIEAYEICECGFNPNQDATLEEIDAMDREAYEALMECGDDGPEWEPEDDWDR